MCSANLFFPVILWPITVLLMYSENRETKWSTQIITEAEQEMTVTHWCPSIILHPFRSFSTVNPVILIFGITSDTLHYKIKSCCFKTWLLKSTLSLPGWKQEFKKTLYRRSILYIHSANMTIKPVLGSLFFPLLLQPLRKQIN